MWLWIQRDADVPPLGGAVTTLTSRSSLASPHYWELPHNTQKKRLCWPGWLLHPPSHPFVHLFKRGCWSAGRHGLIFSSSFARSGEADSTAAPEQHKVVRRILNHKCCIEENKQALPSVQITEQKLQTPQASVRWREGVGASGTVSVLLADVSALSYCNPALFHLPHVHIFSCYLHACARSKTKSGSVLSPPALLQNLLQEDFNKQGGSWPQTQREKPAFWRSAAVKVSVAAEASFRWGVPQRSPSPSSGAGSCPHEIDLLDILALDLNTNDFLLESLCTQRI